MTNRLLYSGLLIELTKEKAPSITLLEYNHFSNKVIYQYINKRYNLYDIYQLLTDDLRVLKSTAVIDVEDQINKYGTINDTSLYSNLFKGIYEIYFPDDYYHILNCMCVFEIRNDDNKCNSQDKYVLYPATRLTADSWTEVSRDYYNRPTAEHPYYCINNINTQTNLPTNPVKDGIGTDMNAEPYSESNSNLPRTITLNNNRNIDTVERETAQRYGNASKVRCEIRCGNDPNYILKKVIIEYIKTPLTLKLTQELIDLIKDTSQIIEFPDYVCNEILNELVFIVMGKAADQRLSIHSLITQSIANPTQQLTTSKP